MIKNQPFQKSRRNFIKKTALLTAAGTLPTVPLLGQAQSANEPVLITVFLRGGADSLSIVVPYMDQTYTSLRPNLRIRAGSGADQCTPLANNETFGLNNAFSDLLPLFNAGEMSFVHGTGSPDDTRSHFEAMDYMDAASPGNRSISEGWLARALRELGANRSYSGISLDSKTNPAFFGSDYSMAVSSSERLTTIKNRLENTRYGIQHPDSFGGVRDTLQRLHDPDDMSFTGNASIVNAVSSTFASLSDLANVAGVQSIDESIYPRDEASTLAIKPIHPFAAALREAAKLIKSRVGVRVIALDLGGWDHHAELLPEIDSLGRTLSASLAAFRQDLVDENGYDHFQRSVVLGTTEFGREVEENGSAGTDHGHGSMMFALGGRLGVSGSGGQVLHADDWSLSDLDRGRYVPITTDFRDVFAEVLVNHMGLSAAQSRRVLLNYSPGSYPGLVG